MTRTDADPLVSSIAVLLTVPLRELYAVLWRVGVVEVRETGRAMRRPPGRASSSAAPGPICPDPSAHDSGWPLRWSQQSRLLGPVPSRAVRAGCSRAVG
ncbi:Rv1535 domain-containing protein [Mycobacterium riyadhense]|uniref:Rv1535 domain-containing protein n=1 Tax=Mycobacterium riyadhense TaxID=486698 RepID=UPI0020128535|nr:Rv1535 domain-containing protein [Mycobacterium riyadhense]